MLSIVNTSVSCIFKFKKGNPVRWELFTEHLKSLDIKQFGGGEAVDAAGAKSNVLIAVHPDAQILYLPEKSIIEIRGDKIQEVCSLSEEVYAILSDLFKSNERLKNNLVFVEKRVLQELEPEFASPFEILHLITPKGLFSPFEDIFDGNRLDLFTYRFYYSPGKIDKSIKTLFPWYDLQLYPQITNPDRFVCDIVCRDTEYLTTKTRCIEMHSKMMDMVNDIDKQVK